MSKTLQRQKILEVRNWVIFMIIIVRLFYHRKERLVGEPGDVKRTINQEFKKLNILLMRGNASLLLNRFQADSVPQEEILEDL